MCDFLSWVKVEEKLFYLDDKALRDSFVKEALRGCKDNDILGHGAIRKVFKIPEGKGVNREQRNFWETEKLPKEIQEKLENFDSWFATMFQHLQNDDLCYIIDDAPEVWKERAWEVLRQKEPSNYDLCCIIIYAPETWKERAYELLLTKSPSSYDLRYIIEIAPEALKGRARKELERALDGS